MLSGGGTLLAALNGTLAQKGTQSALVSTASMHERALRNPEYWEHKGRQAELQRQRAQEQSNANLANEGKHVSNVRPVHYVLTDDSGAGQVSHMHTRAHASA